MTDYRVPLSVQRCARRTLERHTTSESPAQGVAGIKVAEELSSGVITLNRLSQMHRFFQSNRPRYTAECNLMHDETTGPAICSYLLHGGEAADRWTRREYQKAVDGGLIEADPLVELFSKSPEEIYSAFQAGAWRYEYDLNPRKAARFVEEYTRATGNQLELSRAFGESAAAVGQAIYRRFTTPDPFTVAVKASQIPKLSEAAQSDIDSLVADRHYRNIEESMQKSVWSALPVSAAAKLVWPPFVAYMILAVESPDSLKELNKSSLRPVQDGSKPKSYAKYHDIHNTFHAFFNSHGGRYQDADRTTYEGVGAELANLMTRAWRSQALQTSSTKKTLKRAHEFLKNRKSSTGLFSLALKYWQTKNYADILAMLPADHDVRAPFQAFVKLQPKKRLTQRV